MKVTRSSDPILFFSKKEKERIRAAIQAAERKTSGEIRVHLERKAKDDILAHAREVFQKIGMTKTKQRNGVLILMGVKSKRFAILGDQGIHEHVGSQFWEDIAALMIEHFKRDEFAEGLCRGISLIGNKLVAHFPCQMDDVNELPDEISYS